jgi:cysteinyl-tRNA synthetase
MEDKFDKVMQLILNLRAKLRKDKNYQMSDKIRDDLSKIGISVKDSADSATWHIE